MPRWSTVSSRLFAAYYDLMRDWYAHKPAPVPPLRPLKPVRVPLSGTLPVVGAIMPEKTPLEVLDSIAELGDNWDTYDSKAVDPKAVDRARHYLTNVLAKHPERRLHVYPTCAGKVGVEWRHGKAVLAIVFSADGSEMTSM